LPPARRTPRTRTRKRCGTSLDTFSIDTQQLWILPQQLALVDEKEIRLNNNITKLKL
jgi:hypothetical protein